MTKGSEPAHEAESSARHWRIVHMSRLYVSSAAATALVLSALVWNQPSEPLHPWQPGLVADTAHSGELVAALAAAGKEQQPLELRADAYPAEWAAVGDARARAVNGSNASWSASFTSLNASSSSVNEGDAPLPPEAALLGGGTHELSSAGVELVWQAPANASAVLLLAHGCSHRATDWWEAGPGCAQCSGMPEDTRLAGAALANGFFTVAATSADRESGCWHPADDGPLVVAALEELLLRERAQALPRFALGASSGGAFVALLPFYSGTPFAALSIQIMALPPARLTAPLPDKRLYPPSLWVHMPRDAHTAEKVAADVAALRSQGSVAEELEVQPQALTPLFLASRIRGVSPNSSMAAVQALQDADLLDQAGMLRADPRRSSWRQVLQRAGAEEGLGMHALSHDAAPLAEVMNVAWASHEIVGGDDVVSATMAFFARHGSNGTAQGGTETPLAQVTNGTRAGAGAENGTDASSSMS